MDCTTVYYIPTEKYSPKSYVLNFPTQVCSSQSEEQMMFFTCKKSNISNQNCKQCFFFSRGEKRYVQSKATLVHEFHAKFPAFYRCLQLVVPLWYVDISCINTIILNANSPWSILYILTVTSTINTYNLPLLQAQIEELSWLCCRAFLHPF